MVWMPGLYHSAVIGQVAVHWHGGIKISSCMRHWNRCIADVDFSRTSMNLADHLVVNMRLILYRFWGRLMASGHQFMNF